MIHDDNLYEGMRRFFRRLPNYYVIAEDEQIELIWERRGKNRLTGRECFPGLEQAAARAMSLSPNHNVFLQAVVEPGTTPWNTDSTDLLAGWTSALGERGSGGLIAYRLPYVEPSHMWVECFSDGVTTYKATRLYYHSRCSERARVEERRRNRQDEGD